LSLLETHNQTVKQMTREKVILLAAAVLCLALAACAKTEQPGYSPAAANTQAKQPGQCPKVEGAFFGSDKSQISRGESVTLSYKVPWAYGPDVRIEGEGMPVVKPPEISSFKAGPSNSPLTAPTPPGWDENQVEGVKPEKTTKYVLRAKGPEGCPPLELPATVEVK
jgi:hypothetical protein